MPPLPHVIRLSTRRSRGRWLVLRAIVEGGDSYVEEIADKLRIAPWRVRACLHGRMPDYRPELALVFLGLVERRRGRQGAYYVATELGRRVVAELAASGRV